ncbi:uncharacterized protein EI97DRAFT_101281 [Westerdykella ornata]|uniref:Transcriptional regulatory protein RXT2 N-terminal domain-containing protein n=1 Tax=Westerdykella ornata TaxID=318751 RepID=A0A6A6JD16_WESOR|nr:uncharacterized protein EI97DRAFT_101281 [Westerdykella ornata]KAF2274520.1 hypothetical protein EI97DRAFT_101281 [Westerdykella ornata]
MAGQQHQIQDAIYSLKRRLLRSEDSTDDDESDNPLDSNHRQSLKRKSRYTRYGRAEDPAAPPPYKKRIVHAGYQRYILQRNPPKYDPDGDVVEPGDEYEDESELSSVEENPYADIRLEELLAPLTSAADLPNHPGFAPIYTSKHLTNLTAAAAALSRREQILLAQAKRLSTKLMGEPSFIPYPTEDPAFTENLQDSWALPEPLSRPQTNGQAKREEPEVIQVGNAQELLHQQDVVMEDSTVAEGTSSTTVERQNGTDSALPTQNGEANKHTNGEQPNGERPPSPPVDDASEAASHRMTTRARAQAASDQSPPPSPSSAAPYVHPWFTFPTDLLPDRDMGLPAAEAEDTRMLLLAFLQKQEEIARATSELYDGIAQGERMRKEVYRWCVAEGHVGEMSDGEDWYDRDEWGLTEDLAKGRDEEEDDTAVQGKKPTRQRRARGKDD